MSDWLTEQHRLSDERERPAREARNARYETEHKALWTPRVRFNSGYHDGASDALNGRARKWLRGHPEDKIYGQGYDYGFDDARSGEYTENSDEAWKSRASLKAAPWMAQRKTRRK